jgi:hypothetical protein
VLVVARTRVEVKAVVSAPGVMPVLNWMGGGVLTLNLRFSVRTLVPPVNVASNSSTNRMLPELP